MNVLGQSLCFLCILCVSVAPFARPPAAPPSDGPTLIYRKVFKFSSPEFIEIKVWQNGSAQYDIRQLDDAAEPQHFEVSPALAAKLFEMAATLKNFNGVELDVKRRLANLGEKTLRYESSGQAHEVKYNYTLDPTAQQLQVTFEGLGRQQEHLQILQHRARFDRLGVNDALLRFEVDLNKKSIPEPERLIPALEQIAADSRIVEIARQRARALMERIRSSRSS